MDIQMRLLELGRKGFQCSQIMMILALEMDGCENTDLVRAMSGLVGGMGYCEKICGALTGGCCVIGYFTGKGEEEELEHSRSREMIKEYVDWFEKEICKDYDGIECKNIINSDFSKCICTCAPIIELCYGKIMEILMDNEVI